MGQFRLRKKFRVKEEYEVSPSVDNSPTEEVENIRRFKPKSFVMKPKRDQAYDIKPKSLKVSQSISAVIQRNKTLSRRPEIGMVFGKCKLTDCIGKGSSCVVFQAIHQTLKIKVAVKIFMAKDQKITAEFKEQFRSEAQLLARLNSPYIIRVLDFEDTDPPYIILEYVDGTSLRNIIKKKKRIPVEEICRIITHVAEGLIVAHNSGVIHRDVKPENILISKNQEVKIGDLGIALITSGMMEEKEQRSRKGLCGSPAYVSPEQAVDPLSSGPASDVYSLGATFFHAITGRFPFAARSIEEMILKHISESLTPPATLYPTIPKVVSDLIVAMMEKNMENRISLEEIKAQLLVWEGNMSCISPGIESKKKPVKLFYSGMIRQVLSKVFTIKRK